MKYAMLATALSLLILTPVASAGIGDGTPEDECGPDDGWLDCLIVLLFNTIEALAGLLDPVLDIVVAACQGTTSLCPA